MALGIKGQVVLPADRQTVWTNLNDPDVLKACISSLQFMERTSDTTFLATARIRIGPLVATFRGKIELSNVDMPNACRIEGAGAGGLAGFAKGSADVTLTEVPEGTRLTYEVEANLGGRLAQMGGNLIGGIAKRTADQFFSRFTATLARKEALTRP